MIDGINLESDGISVVFVGKDGNPKDQHQRHRQGDAANKGSKWTIGGEAKCKE